MGKVRGNIVWKNTPLILTHHKATTRWTGPSVDRIDHLRELADCKLQHDLRDIEGMACDQA